MNNQKLTFKDVILMLIPLLVGAVCLLLWMYELHQVIGWQGVKWLRQPIQSVYVITFLIVLTFLLPLIVVLKMPIGWTLFYTILLYGASLVAFFSARAMFHTLYTRGLVLGDEALIAYSIWKLLGIVILLSIIYFIPMRHFHKKTDGMHVLTIIVAFISVIPASIICVETIPLWNHRAAFLDAVKIGYPAFWVPVFLGMLSTAAAKEWI
jgi:hypothetical protein